MAMIREVLYQNTKGVSNRQIAKAFDLSRKTVGKYIDLAKQNGLTNDTKDLVLEEIALKVHELVYKTSDVAILSRTVSLM